MSEQLDDRKLWTRVGAIAFGIVALGVAALGGTSGVTDESIMQESVAAILHNRGCELSPRDIKVEVPKDDQTAMFTVPCGGHTFVVFAGGVYPNRIRISW